MSQNEQSNNKPTPRESTGSQVGKAVAAAAAFVPTVVGGLIESKIRRDGSTPTAFKALDKAIEVGGKIGDYVQKNPGTSVKIATTTIKAGAILKEGLDGSPPRPRNPGRQ